MVPARSLAGDRFFFLTVMSMLSSWFGASWTFSQCVFLHHQSGLDVKFYVPLTEETVATVPHPTYSRLEHYLEYVFCADSEHPCLAFEPFDRAGVVCISSSRDQSDI